MGERRVVGILLCAGSAMRMGFDKLLTPLCGKTAIERSAEALIAGGVTRLVCTTNEQTNAFLHTLTFSVPTKIVFGGATRQASVKNGLLSDTGDIAVIHDAARCMVTAEQVRACIDSAAAYGSGIAAQRVCDTVLRQAADGTIAVVPRDEVLLMQTPQVFCYDAILRAYESVDIEATDDCSLYAASGKTPHFVDCGTENFKLTTPQDWARAVKRLTRYGTGFDTHCLVEERKLILGGVEIPFEKGLMGHSDADVLLHAIMDALLGAASLGDIGKLFPDNDAAYKGADSMVLFCRVVERLKAMGLCVGHIDATIIAQRPKMAPHIPSMRENIARTAGIPVDAVSIKATTTEHMNDEGRGKCISAQAIASVL